MTQQTTSILMRLANGDQSAADDCVREYCRMVWRLARRYLGAGNEEVNDGVQEVFLELWLSAARFDPAKGSEAAFIATIAHRRLIDACRRLASTRQRDGYPSTAPELLRHTQSNADTTTKADQEALRAVFNELPEVEREALWMSMFAGLSHREIGEATEVPVGTVKSRLRRGLARMIQGANRGGRVAHDRPLHGGSVR